ncbi:MAG: hypothetical protein KYX69_11615 [Sphingomonas sp.]|uniref:hypothetical protein n=1 Tax=Sphingomonas sp. TaxID=28214 RepID=UPI00263A0376|nr:hypothetical protein [Sphingomonas sp.]MDK2768353.1 hypothetical protein [Sphingomonas sp.]
MTEPVLAHQRPFNPATAQFMNKLRLYPNLTAVDVDEMIALYRGLSLVEINLIAADVNRPKQFDTFVDDHYDRLHGKWSDHVPGVLGVIGPLVVIAALLWATVR